METKKEIRNKLKTVKKATRYSVGKYQVTINGKVFDNFQKDKPIITSHPKGDYDTPLKKYYSGKNQSVKTADNKKEFVDAVYEIINGNYTKRETYYLI